ncbi:MAG: DUF4215 domain-containing protein [Spirochaetia bacterium]|nr:DUF4215 domain-containing protein [Spirochaetia bacterium]
MKKALLISLIFSSLYCLKGQQFDPNSIISMSICGNRMLELNEDCDEGGIQTETCEQNCKAPACGDKVINNLVGEECEDGNVEAGDGCDAACKIEVKGEPVCGDGIVEGTEQCDGDGNGNGGETIECNLDCTASLCGDGVANNTAGEDCDSNGTDSGTCNGADCTLVSCGDGYANNVAGEVCDDGNTITEICAYGETSCTVCSSACTSVSGALTGYCGDNVINGGETCDDGNTVGSDGCSANCQDEGASICGNGIVQAGEICDDGNTVSESACGYGIANCVTCNAACDSELNLTGNICGDGVQDINPSNETCDDNNTVSGDGCSASCKDENFPICGDNVVNGTETCDDGNTITETCAYGQASCIVCNDSCVYVNGTVIGYCGDGTVNGPEACDDGNTIETDACLSNCQPPVCGDNIVNGTEVCDDGNTIDETSCPYGTSSCTKCNSTCDTSLSLTGPVCGDGTQDAGEICDDGNTVSESACPYGTASCTKCDATCVTVLNLTGSVCGDNVVNAGNGEICDDGNTTTETACDYGNASCSKCNSTCSSTISLTGPYCGDGVVNGSEVCDDDNTVTETACPYGTSSCTTCNSTCSTVLNLTGEYCGDGTINGSEVCDDSNTVTESSCAYGTASCVKCDASCSTVLNLTGPVCGDNIVNGAEVCDDGNTIDETSCPYGTSSCTKCNSTCDTSLSLTGPVCGDGTQDAGETCDDGNTITETSCGYGTGSCVKCDSVCGTVLNLTGPVCGDNIVNGAEVCDDGNTIDETSCPYGTSSCTKCNSTCDTSLSLTGPVCGDGIQDAGETCDDGNTITETSCGYGTGSCVKCDSVCGTVLNLTGPVCGDNIVNGTEVCDDGNTIDETSCPYGTSSCTKCNSTCDTSLSLTGPVCGDGTQDAGEICDDGNTTTETACAYGTPTCTACDAVCMTNLNLVGNYCGDNAVNGTEVCDDGDTVTETSCDYGTASCTLCDASCSSTLSLTGPVCGDNIVNGTEVCDDGDTITEIECDYGTTNCTLCDAVCSAPLTLTGRYCGDGTADTGDAEECDNSGVQSASCEVNCLAPVCGDNILNTAAGEQCDNGVSNNDSVADACRTTCFTSSCGDNVIDTGEACDDGVSNSDVTPDACRTTCEAPSCGDGAVDTGEICDSGAGVSYTFEDGLYPADFTLDPLNYNWSPNNTTASSGVYSFASYTITHSQNSCFTKTVSTGESVSFDYSVSTEPCCDYLKFYINGAQQLSSSGSVSWSSSTTYTLPQTGNDELKWCYTKDGSVNTGSDKVWVDNILVSVPESPTCDFDCTEAVCGDWYINTAAGEECDEGGETTACNWNCTEASCGDGVVNVTAGEVCDDGNAEINDGCAPSCLPDADMKPPAFSNISFSGTPTGPSGEYLSGDSITLRADVSDASGVSWVTLYVFQANVTVSAGSCSGVNIGGNTYQCSFTLGAITPNGTEHVLIQSSDTIGNSHYYYFSTGYSSNYYYTSLGNTTTTEIVYVPMGGQYCSNGLVEGTETCDDGNLVSNDGCSSLCVFDADLMGPIFSNMSFSGAPSGASGEFIGGDTITLFADITDFSGINAGNVQLYVYQADIMSSPGSCPASFVGGNTYSCSITVPGGYVGNGTEHVLPYAQDGMGNIEYYYMDTAFSLTNYYASYEGVVKEPEIVFIPMGGSFCGNGITETGESCDTGGDSASCDADCTFVVCNDGYINSIMETCEDGNTTGGDGCSSSCKTEPVLIPGNVTGTTSASDFANSGFYSMYLPTLGQSEFFSFNATGTTQYAIYWDDSYDGTGTYSADIWMSAIDSTFTTLFSMVDSGYNFPQIIYPAPGMVTLEANANWLEGTLGVNVLPYNIISINSGYQVFNLPTFQGSILIAFPVTVGQSYTVYWDDSYSGSGAYSADIWMSAFQDGPGGTVYFTTVDSGYSIPRTFIANTTGMVYLEANANWMPGSLGVSVSSP